MRTDLPAQALGILWPGRGAGDRVCDRGIERVSAAGGLDELNRPVPCAEERVGPFEEGDRGSVRVRVDVFRGLEKPGAEFDHHSTGLLRQPDGCTNSQEVVENAFNSAGIRADNAQDFGARVLASRSTT